MKPKTEPKNKLVKQGYDILDCPICEKTCLPTLKLKNGTIRYASHDCFPDGMSYLSRKRHFSININGELIGL